MSAQIIQLSVKTRRQYAIRSAIRELIVGRDVIAFPEVRASVPGRIGYDRGRRILKAEGFERIRSSVWRGRGDLFQRSGTCNWDEEKALREKYYPTRPLSSDEAAMVAKVLSAIRKY